MKTGKAHAARRARATENAKADAVGRSARRALEEAPRVVLHSTGVKTKFGKRNALLITARIARGEARTEALAQANAIAPLTARERRR